MKQLFTFSFAGILCALFLIQAGVSSCTKDQVIYDTVKVNTIQHDTIVVKDTALTMQLLTAHSWRMQEIRGVSNNVAFYYLRGGSSNTQSFDNDVITFRPDKTGTYTDNSGNSFSLTWNFTNSNNTSIVYTMPNSNLAPNLVVTWENLKYKNASLLYDEYYTAGTKTAHSHVVRIL
jgi:hypothetical protein